MNKKFDFTYNQLRGGKSNSRIYIPISLRGCYEITTYSTYLLHFYESLSSFQILFITNYENNITITLFLRNNGSNIQK